MTDPSPEELLDRISKGCTDSLSQLYDGFSAALYGIALGILKNEAEAQEVLQEAFIALWEKADRYDPGLGKASSWIIHLTRNLAIDRLRKRQRQHVGQERFLEQRSPEPEVAEPSSALISQERAARVQAALRALSPEYRSVLELAFFHGLTQSEIAERLQLPLGTAKSRIRRAMERVRLLMTDSSTDFP
ncbi:RNA polymerase sigma-70 factor (ECF subfamily) [Haloferula luteola]|uniref:RNA polymerase sigma-70 factor (ECF subfamily) n=1 Tax=Haloferula luteola TaxID=595692 RepID=A0A840V075_9BACT|nr:sigma-70 family RNA polymerase sigma factor [Haloferula luteola]MBB5350683.1 RNA polymerase sigma-70 factor (ECF subfamily) [Haloferula luteola]